MRFLSRVLWLVTSGVPYFLLYLVCGIACCLSIVGIPFGIQFFKLMMVALRPYSCDVEVEPGEHLVANLIWDATFGIAIAIEQFAMGILWCVTIIGIPFGIHSFKLMKVAYAPFGAEIDFD